MPNTKQFLTLQHNPNQLTFVRIINFGVKSMQEHLKAQGYSRVDAIP